MLSAYVGSWQAADSVFAHVQQGDAARARLLPREAKRCFVHQRMCAPMQAGRGVHICAHHSTGTECTLVSFSLLRGWAAPFPSVAGLVRAGLHAHMRASTCINACMCAGYAPPPYPPLPYPSHPPSAYPPGSIAAANFGSASAPPPPNPSAYQGQGSRQLSQPGARRVPREALQHR